MTVAPDGRTFVAEKGGTLRVVQNGALLPTPFRTLSVNTFSERGLIGIDVATRVEAISRLVFDPTVTSGIVVG